MADTGSGSDGALHIYTDGDIALHGELYRPSQAANGRAVLVVHEADGIGENVRRHCRRLADLGYVALAADMHGGGQVLEGTAMVSALERFKAQPDLLRGRVRAGFDALRVVADVDAARCAAIGFCFGGFAVLELARSGAAVAAVGSFHGLLTTRRPVEPGAAIAPVAVFTGARDPLVPADDVASFAREMTLARADWQMMVYGDTLHSFTNEDVGMLDDPRMGYDAEAHAHSWQSLTTFLSDKLG